MSISRRHEANYVYAHLWSYTPEPKHHGYDLVLRRQALQLYVDGTNFRRIARHLGVHHQSVINWVNAATAHLPSPATPGERQGEETVAVLELDELHTFIGKKKKSPTSPPV